MIIIPWKNYFARKGWDTHAWAKARKIESYTQCVSRIKKMKVTSPSREEYEAHFCMPVFDHRAGSEDKPAAATAQDPENIAPPKKTVKPEPVVEKSPLAKDKVVVEKVVKEKAPAVTGTDAILQNLKKKSPTKKTRASKKKASTKKTTRSTKKA